VATIDYWAAKAVLPVPTLKTRSGRDLRRATPTQLNMFSSSNLTDTPPSPHYPISSSSEGPANVTRDNHATRAIAEMRVCFSNLRQTIYAVLRCVHEPHDTAARQPGYDHAVYVSSFGDE
jgi:peptidase E